MAMNAYLLIIVQLLMVVWGQKHGDKFQGEQWGANPKDPYNYDPELDPKDEKRFDPIRWYNEIFSVPERSLSLVTETEDFRSKGDEPKLGNFIVHDSAPSRWTFP